MPLFIDQLQRPLVLEKIPTRIVSLVPSQTELLFYLGLEKEVIGITKFCIHPADSIKVKTVVGGTKKFNIEKIDELQPDLIVGNKEENYQEGIELLSKKYPVWMSDIVSLQSSYAMIEELGKILGRVNPAKTLVNSLRSSIKLIPQFTGKTVLYVIWRKPWMAVGKETFIDNVLSSVGFTNVVTENRYPSFLDQEAKRYAPDYVFLSSEPYPFTLKHLSEVQQLFPLSKILLIDGELFSWYGSRLLLLPDYLKSLQLSLNS